MLRIEQVSKSFSDVSVLNQVSLSVTEGEIVGLVGANGAGKTTLIKSILGLHQIDAGTISFQGDEDYLSRAEQMAAIGYLLDIELLDYLTAKEHIELMALYEGTQYSLDDVTALLERVALKNDSKKIKAYSYGMKQRLRLALSMLRPRKLLILDEPLLGLDITAIQEFKHYLKELSQQGVSILLSSHQLAEIDDLIDRYVILEQGRISQEIIGESSCFKLTVEPSQGDIGAVFNWLQEQELLEGVVFDDNALWISEQERFNAILKALYKHDMDVQWERVNVVNQLFLSKGGRHG